MRQRPLRGGALGFSVSNGAGEGQNMNRLLLQFLFYLLLVILQIHDGLLGHFQVSFQLPLHSLQVSPQFLLLL